MATDMYEAEIDALMQKMSVDEKLGVLAQTGNQYGAIPSLDFTGIVPQDVPRGGEDNWLSGKPVRDESGKITDGKFHPVAYPANAALAMSWDTALAYHIGEQFAKEARANPEAVHVLNRPAMNLKRDARCGRNYDYFSEDPVLTGKLAAAYIKGLQDNGVSACPKHFLANTQEYDRMNTNEIIDDRTLHEVYLRTWQLALSAKPDMLMSAYNRVNGFWVNSSEKLMKALREETGFDGIVVSDFLAVQNDKVQAHKCGMEIELAQGAVHTHELKAALETGEFTTEELDKLVRRVLRLALKAKKRYAPYAIDDAESESMHKDAVSVAEQCITLLKNDGSLPLSPSSHILVAGLLAKEPVIAGSGSGFMNGYRAESPYDELGALGFSADYAQGYEASTARPPIDIAANAQLIAEAKAKAQNADVVLAFVGSTLAAESESYDRSSLKLPQAQQEMLNALFEANKNVVIVLTAGSAYELAPWSSKACAIVYAGLSGEGYGTAVSRVLAGLSEPGGRLAETFPLCLEHTPSYFNFTPAFTETANVTFGEGLLTGYRWYDTRKLPVLYPFGHGLSYTTFSYTDASADKTEIIPGETCTVRLTVANTGNRAGSTVIQLYVHEKGGLYLRPEKELKDFKKVYLKAGEKKTVQFEISRQALELYSDTLQKWGVQTDDYELILATSASTPIASLPLHVTSSDVMSKLTPQSPLVKFVHCPAFHAYLKAHKPEWMQHFFTLSETDFLVLMLPLPFHRLSEPVQGEPMFTPQEICDIVAYCNKQ